MRLTRRGVGWDRARRARFYSILGRIMALVGTAGVAINVDPYLMLPELLAVLMPLAMMLGIVSMLAGLLVGTEERREAMGDVEVDAEGALDLRAGNQSRRFARSELRGAWIVRTFDGRRLDQWVEVVTRDDTAISVHVISEEEGRALVEALGFESGGRAVRIPLALRSRRRFHLLFAFAAYAAACLPASGNTGLPFLLAPVIYALMRFAFRAPVLEIGHDAVHLKVDFRTIRIPREDIARVTFVKPSALVIERKDGSEVRVRSMWLEPVRAVAAAELIDERVGNRPAPVRAAAFERAGRGLVEWLAGIKTALEPDYRTSGTSTDDAATVLASSTASVEQRIGAALALRVAGEPLEKVRIAAEGTVDPKSRVVLEAIAEGADDEHLDETLRAMKR